VLPGRQPAEPGTGAAVVLACSAALSCCSAWDADTKRARASAEPSSSLRHRTGLLAATPGNVCWSSRELTQPTAQQRRPAGSLAQSRRHRPGRQRSGAAGGLGRPADHRLARHLVRLPARKQAIERCNAHLCGLRRGALGEQLRQQRQAVQHKGQVNINASRASHASTTAGARAPHSVITRVRCVHAWVVRRKEVPDQSY